MAYKVKQLFLDIYFVKKGNYMPTNNAWNSNIPVEISKGGTNASTMATSTGIVKYDGTRLVTSGTALIDSSNRYTNTSQPAFNITSNAPLSNVTGDNTIYTVVFNTTEFDQGTNFSGGTTFTAPITGKYFLQTNLFILGTLVTHTGAVLKILNGVNPIAGTSLNPFNSIADGSDACGISTSTFAALTAGDTITVTLSVSGGAKVIIIPVADGTPSFSGFLFC
jgi:hypothetical protein